MPTRKPASPRTVTVNVNDGRAPRVIRTKEDGTVEDLIPVAKSAVGSAKAKKGDN